MFMEYIGIGNYKNREMREKAYESMRSELNFLGLSVDNIKTKIKTVRTNYKSELKKILKSEKVELDWQMFMYLVYLGLKKLVNT